MLELHEEPVSSCFELKMNNVQDQENSQDIKPNIISHDSHATSDSSSVSESSNDNKKVSREDIELVQHLIERCLQMYMNKDEVVKTLLNRARIDPGFTTLVWQKLEEENADFFWAYYVRLKLKKQIILFNNLLEYQYQLMKYPVLTKVPLSPIQNGIHPMPVNNLPTGYPVIQPPSVPATGQPYINPMAYSASSCHIVNGVPAPGNNHPMQMNFGNDMVIDTNTGDVSPIVPPNNAMSSMLDIPVSPTSVASSGHFPFSPSEKSCMGVDTAFTCDNGVEHSIDSIKSLSQIPWNFSFSDLTADLSNLGDLGALGNYSGSPFLPSDSDILLDSPEQDIVEEFFVDSDSVPGQCQSSDEEKS